MSVHAEDKAEHERMLEQETPRPPIVIIPQYPTELTRGKVRRRRIDLSDAERFGQLVEIVDTSAKPWDPGVIEHLDASLCRTRPDDWLLAIGNPTMIAIAAASLGAVHGTINVLQWQSKAGRYEAVRVTFTEDGTVVQQVPCLPNQTEE